MTTSTAPARICLIQGHPDPDTLHLGHTLADAYRQGAIEAGHDVREIDVATLDFPLLKNQYNWKEGSVPPSLLPAQAAIAWASHIVLFYPLWLGDMPALLKGFLEQVARPGFAFGKDPANPFEATLKGRSAQVVVTMGMPALVYRWYFRAHSLKSLERNVLGFVGMSPVRHTLVGSVEGLGEAGVRKWKAKLRAIGSLAH
jgi:putative NADPH-quinone reductase